MTVHCPGSILNKVIEPVVRSKCNAVSLLFLLLQWYPFGVHEIGRICDNIVRYASMQVHGQML